MAPNSLTFLVGSSHTSVSQWRIPPLIDPARRHPSGLQRYRWPRSGSLLTNFIGICPRQVGTPFSSRVPGSGVRGRGSGERETTASSLAGKQQAREKEDNGGQGKEDLLELLHKGGMDGDVDFLREALRVLVEGIMDAEVSSRIGAEYGERCPERVTQRNGYRSRRGIPV